MRLMLSRRKSPQNLKTALWEPLETFWLVFKPFGGTNEYQSGNHFCKPRANPDNPHTETRLNLTSKKRLRWNALAHPKEHNIHRWVRLKVFGPNILFKHTSGTTYVSGIIDLCKNDWVVSKKLLVCWAETESGLLSRSICIQVPIFEIWNCTIALEDNYSSKSTFQDARGLEDLTVEYIRTYKRL